MAQIVLLYLAMKLLARALMLSVLTCAAATMGCLADGGEPEEATEAENKSSIAGTWHMVSTEAYAVEPAPDAIISLLKSMRQAVVQAQWGLNYITIPSDANELGFMQWRNYNTQTDHGYYFTGQQYHRYDSLNYLEISAQEQLFDADGNEVAGEVGTMYLSYYVNEETGELTMTSVLYPLGGATSASTKLRR